MRDTKTPGKCLLDPATPGQPQTNGVAEKAVQDITTQVRKYKIALETRLGIPIPARSVIFKWLVRHAADTINRSLTGHDGKVPLQRLLNKMPQPIDIEFGEKVFAKVPNYLDKRKRSLQERAVEGTWLGIWAKTGQSLVAISPSKVVRVRSVPVSYTHLTLPTMFEV